MDRLALLETLWSESAALVALHRPKDHDGRTDCGCSWCRCSGILRVLDGQFGADLARVANERLMQRREEIAAGGEMHRSSGLGQARKAALEAPRKGAGA